ncbi:MAG: hypothetical protein L6V78_07885 [Clostridium sp.]|nr:MAG: hypothetical protein L6V78_07885 [Clostridium sp.]
MKEIFLVKSYFYIKELTNIEYYDNPSEEVINTLSLFKENIAKIKELGGRSL